MTGSKGARPRRASTELAELVASAAAGDADSWEALVSEFGSMVWAVARAHRLTDADASDVVQCTWLRLLEHLERLEDRSRVGAWLATTARREALRVVRQGKRSVPYGDDAPEVAAAEPASVQRLLVAERDRALWQGFARLRPADQALLRLLIAEPRPAYEEISAALDMPIGSIGPTRARALERLRAELASDDAISLLAA